MIRLLQRRSELARGELVEIRKILYCLKSSPAQTRLAVGAGVHLANTDFICRFGGMRCFYQIPLVERGQFYSQLSDLESSLRSDQSGMALGVGLYRIWLANVVAGRRDAANLLGQELTELSRKAASDRPTDGRE